LVLSTKDGAGKEVNRQCIKVFDKGYVEGVENFAGCLIPKAVGLGMWCIANESARGGALTYLRIVGGYQRKCLAPNLSEMR
jgi:hypothetical protein